MPANKRERTRKKIVMKIHVLPGDSLVESFKETNIEGEVVICRECLIDGDVTAISLDDFWQVREKYLSASFEKPENFYLENVKSEFNKLLNLNEKDEVNLWFEYELFCQTNMWFCLSLLKDAQVEIYRVAPVIKNQKDIWKGFGILGREDLQRSFVAREKFSRKDLELGVNLWNAYQKQEFEKLETLSKTESKCFPGLEDVCKAEIEKEDRPKAVLRKIMENGETNFGAVFQKFNETEGIYGFGDLQVKRIYDQLAKA